MLVLLCEVRYQKAVQFAKKGGLLSTHFTFRGWFTKGLYFFTEHILTCQSKKSTDVNNEIIVTLSWLTGTLEWNKTIVKVFCNSCYDKSECLLWKKAFKQEEILPGRGRNWFLYPINNELSRLAHQDEQEAEARITHAHVLSICMLYLNNLPEVFVSPILVHCWK